MLDNISPEEQAALSAKSNLLYADLSEHVEKLPGAKLMVFNPVLKAAEHGEGFLDVTMVVRITNV